MRRENGMRLCLSAACVSLSLSLLGTRTWCYYVCLVDSGLGSSGKQHDSRRTASAECIENARDIFFHRKTSSIRKSYLEMRQITKLDTLAMQSTDVVHSS